MQHVVPSQEAVPDMEMLVCPLKVLQSSGIHLITLVSLSSLKSQHGRQCYTDGKDKFRMVWLFFFDKPVLQNSCRHIWKPELSKTTAITNYIYSTCFNKCPEKKGFQSMCFNQQVSSVDRNLHGYGSEPFSPSDSPKHEQTSLTNLSLVLIHYTYLINSNIYVYIYRHKIIIYSMVDIDPSHNHSTWKLTALDQSF